MKHSILFFSIVVIIFSGCVSKEKKENTISISGAFALYPMVIKWSEAYKKDHHEVRFNISGGGAGKGMADALSGSVDLGMFSREIASEEKNQGVWWIGLCKDAVLPTICDKNPYLSLIKKRGVTQKELTAIFIDGTIKDWSQLFPEVKAEIIEVYTRSDACGAAETWGQYLGGKQEDLSGIGIHGDPGLADAVAKDKLSIGYNNTAYVYDINTGKKHPGLEVIPIDFNENGVIDPEEMLYDTFDNVLQAIAVGDYPSPPARELYFVAKGKPKKESVINFIRWTLTSGQQYVKEAGYVPISQEKINYYLKTIE